MSLIQRATGGDVGAFTELVSSYRNLVFGYAAATLGDVHLAEDATQETFLAAFASLGGLREEAAFPGWLRGIARNQCLRILRRRDLGQSALPAEIHSTDSGPPANAAREELRVRALRAVRSLPAPLRAVVTLGYLKGCSQQEIAGFLGLPVTTVNNRLHKARRLLERRWTTMVTDALGETQLPDDYADRIGNILRVRGPLVEARFDPDSRPSLFDALGVAGDGPQLRVVQVKDDGVVRCVVAGGGAELAPGTPIENRTAAGGTYFAPALTDADLERTVAAVAGTPQAEPRPMVEVGIKSIDLFCPVPRGGTFGLFGTSGVGKMVCLLELAHRLSTRKDDVRLVYLGARSEPALVRDFGDQSTGFPQDVDGAVSVHCLLTDRATDPLFVESAQYLDAAVFFSPMRAVQGLWPAVDGQWSRSSVSVSDRHARVAASARDALRRAHELTADTLVLELLGCCAWQRAREILPARIAERLAALDEADRTLVARTRRLERYLTTPFFVAEDFTGRPGLVAPFEQTLDAVEAILRGDVDDVPEERFVFAPNLASARG